MYPVVAPVHCVPYFPGCLGSSETQPQRFPHLSSHVTDVILLLYQLSTPIRQHKSLTKALHCFWTGGTETEKSSVNDTVLACRNGRRNHVLKKCFACSIVLKREKLEIWKTHFWVPSNCICMWRRHLEVSFEMMLGLELYLVLVFVGIRMYFPPK